MSTVTTGREELRGWGLQPGVEAAVSHSAFLEPASEGASLARGLGRAYGDAAVPVAGAQGPVMVTTAADRILSFDEGSGLLRAEAGLSLGSLRTSLLARRWFVPVSPGTRFVTLGGMVAADIHGKNHHVAGTIGRHIHSLKLRIGTGEIVECSREQEPELFQATLGGMGLTGHILEVGLKMERLSSPWIHEESRRFPNLEKVMEALKEDSESWPMTVAWIDTTATGASLGRGIVMRGRWAEASQAPSKPPKERSGIPMPFGLPSGVLNPLTFGLMNTFWYAKSGSGEHRRIVHPESYFWPLDRILGWNRAYGARGFAQYQCVMPSDPEAFRHILQLFQQGGGSSFVTVLKDCGEVGEGMLSFPKSGTSLALDIPIGPGTADLVHRMDEHVLGRGGRIYLAKDSFTRAEDFAQMYPRLEEFMAVRRRVDPHGQIRSAQSARLGLDPR